MKKSIRLMIASILAIIFSLIFYFNTFKLPAVAAKLPRILIGLIILLALGIMIQAYVSETKIAKANRIQNKEPGEEKDDSEEKFEPINYRQAIIFTIMIAAYIFLLEPIGYFIITPIYIVSTYIFLNATKVRNIVFISIGFTAFVYFLFVVFLKLPIPMGLLQ